jgi:DNA polymerase III gamma/tau subunit
VLFRSAGANIEDGGLALIARAAQGGMRDALSLADQCLAFCGDRVTTRDVYGVLGSMEDAFLFDLSGALLRSDAPAALKMLDAIVQNGRDLSVFAADLAAHFRALLLAKACGRCEDLLDCTEDEMKRYLEQANPASEARLLLALDWLSAAQNEMRYLPAPRALLESALIHICRPEDSVSLTNIEARLDRLEAQLKNGTFAHETPAPKPAKPPEAKREAAPPPKSDPGRAPEPQEEESSPVIDSHEAVSPVKFSEIVASPPQKNVTAPAPARSGEKPAAGAEEAATIWRKTIDNIPNMFVQALARDAAALRFEQNTLTVAFPDTQETKLKNLSAPVNFKATQRALQSLKPEAKLIVITAKAAPPTSESAEALAKELFGDKLTIE